MAPFLSDFKTETKPVKPRSLEQRSLMLKDFLSEDTNSSPWNNFLSFPIRSDSDTTVRKLIHTDLNTKDTNNERKLHKSRSKASLKTISALHQASETVINALKHLPFTTVKSSLNPTKNPSKQGILLRNFSRKLRRSFWKKNEEVEREISIKVRVKDIIRWKSFAESDEKENSFNFSSPIHNITTTTSSRSSCSENDSESDFLQSSSSSSEYSGENEGKNSFLPEKNGVGEDSLQTVTCYGKPKAEEESQGVLDSSSPDDKEQLSPVSVLDFPFEDEDTTSSSFQQSLANMERSKHKIRRFEKLAELDRVNLEKRIAESELESTHSSDEEDEERARTLLKLIKTSLGESTKTNSDMVLLDFFREGLEWNRLSREEAKGNELEEELLSWASDWLDGYGEMMGWGVEDNREAHVKEIERGDRWRKFLEEEDDLTVEIESGILSSLVEELWPDLSSRL
ncbi:uncharacterized protein LOC143886470 [Tasmannia lanceolata]|uniref:uncharacterized protein LOC143886470 n=1 Tax=Tasmannia lanceolata TaxID=3420 RepID=UPI00406335D3